MWQHEQLDIAKFAIAEYEPHAHIDAPAGTFEIKTCQRTLLLYGLSSELKSKLSLAKRHYEGSEAYDYFLRFSCGLESQIKGETDVFGQVKTAFKNLTVKNPQLANSMKAIFLKAFEDTKEIRANFLQGIGGNTYGALARRLMNPTTHDRVLVVGAGDISKSVAPYFADFSLTIWNRSPDRLNELGSDLAKKGHSPTLSTCEIELAKEVSNASLILIATPFQSSIESVVAKNITPNTKVIHLGAQAREANTLPFTSLSLTDLFEMEREQGELRDKQVRQAIQACHERALLRNLSRSIVAHGWEDLAVFF
jgi:glutamyl-tRNA reductase